MIIDYSWFLFINNNSWFSKAILFLFNLVIITLPPPKQWQAYFPILLCYKDQFE